MVECCSVASIGLVFRFNEDIGELGEDHQFLRCSIYAFV